MMANNKKRSAAGANRRHLNNVLRTSRASYGTYAVLEALIRKAEFDRPEVTITKPQLEIEARRTPKTIKKALKELRDEGSIVPIRNFVGGRGNAVTYRLCVAGQGGAGQSKKKEGEAGQAIWATICAQFEQIDGDIFSAWIEPLHFVQVEAGCLTLEAPTAFMARYVENNHGAMLTNIAAQADASIRSLKIRVTA